MVHLCLPRIKNIKDEEEKTVNVKYGNVNNNAIDNANINVYTNSNVNINKKENFNDDMIMLCKYMNVRFRNKYIVPIIK